MNTVVIGETVRIPDWVQDLDSFRRWARSDDFPEHGWFSHLNGELWVDLSMERHAHNQLKVEFTIVLGALVKSLKLGYFYQDRMLLTNLDAQLSTEPDAMFVSWETLRSGDVVLDEGPDTLEVLGRPDMVLEVISPTSVKKDTVVLRDLYDQAGVPEYWLVDGRKDTVAFDILRYTARGYVATRKQSGWLKSRVFGKSFRLTQQVDPRGNPAYNLEVR
jgi:Uma2 family endonuclease